MSPLLYEKKPGDIKLTFWHMFRSGMLRTPQILGQQTFKRLMQFDQLVTEEKKRCLGKQDYWYCWLLGTNPQYQNQGFGSALMEDTFKMANKDKLPCCLETASEASKKIHQSKGYKILSEIALPESDITITLMIKNSSLP